LKILIDTQVLFLASTTGLAAFPKKLQAILADPETERVLSSVSILEIAIKHRSGKMDFPEELLSRAIGDLRISTLPFTARHAYELYSLPKYHEDPWDRMIIATALVERIPLAGGDREFRKYKDINVIWR
jgi:PIN domain nuclease of toxin-antitoxin system